MRIELRLRWPSLVALALLITLATGTVLAAFAGARRGDSALRRLADRTLPATAYVQMYQPGFDWKPIRHYPDVTALATYVQVDAKLAGIPVSNLAVALLAGDDQWTRTIERPVVLDGRLARPDQPDEAVVTQGFVSRYGHGVGDTVTAELPSIEQQGLISIDAPAPAGPHVPLHIVGIVRSPWFADGGGLRGRLLPSAAFLAKYRANLFNEKLSWFDALVRLRGGEAAIPAFTRHLIRRTKNPDLIVGDLVDDRRHRQRTASFEARWLVAFGAVALVAGLVLVGQAVARHVATNAANLDVLRALGMTPAEEVVAASVGPVLAAAAGSSLAAAGAWYASGWFPIGIAADSEPNPGRQVDALVFGLGWLGAVSLVGLGATVAAWRALRTRRAAVASRTSVVASLAARAQLPVPIVIGSRFAFETGGGRATVPVRQALLAAVAGVIGVVAAATFSAGVTEAVANPVRFGQTHQLEVWLGFQGEDIAPHDTLEVVARDRDVTGVNDWHYGSGALADGSTLPMSTYQAVREPMPVVLLSGRMPATAQEIALAPNSADAAGAHVGSTVAVTGTKQTRHLRVTGIAFVTAASHCTACTDHATGAWVTSGAFDSLFRRYQFRLGEITLRPGADVGKVAARLHRAIAAHFGPAADVPLAAPFRPAATEEVQQLRALPIALGAFLVALAIGALAHALLTVVRRRRRELGVWRALGMTGRQVRAVVVTQASVIALVGLAFGIPLGIALGRAAWRAVADYTPLQFAAPAAALASLVVVPLALLLANLLAAWPGHQAARPRVAEVLRAE